jgi:hypothetical protein
MARNDYVHVILDPGSMEALGRALRRTAVANSEDRQILSAA